MDDSSSSDLEGARSHQGDLPRRVQSRLSSSSKPNGTAVMVSEGRSLSLKMDMTNRQGLAVKRHR